MSFIVDCLMWLLAAICFIVPAFRIFNTGNQWWYLLIKENVRKDIKYEETLVQLVDNDFPHYQIFNLEDPYYYSLKLGHIPAYAEFRWSFSPATVVMVNSYYEMRANGEIVPFELAAWKIAAQMNMSLSTFLWIFEDAEIPAWMAVDGHSPEIAIQAKRDFLMDFYAN